MPASDFFDYFHSQHEKYFGLYQKGEITFQGQRRGRIQSVFGGETKLSDEEADARFNIYLEYYENHWNVFSDTISCLDSLGEIKLGIVTNGNPDQQNKKLVKTGIQGRFSEVICSEEVGFAKPNPEIFRIAAKRMGVLAGDCIYV